jgi:hypothetical protein
MAGQRFNPGLNDPLRLQVVGTPATDSDLNELLSALSSQIKGLRRENKQLAGFNHRLAVVLVEQGVVIPPPQPQPGPGLLTPKAATGAELLRELARRLEMLEGERRSLHEENARLTNLLRQLNLPAWRIEETRVGISRLAPGPRVFIRRRRSEPTPIRTSVEH